MITSASEQLPAEVARHITVACLDLAGTTVADDGSVMAAFGAAAAEFGIVPGAPGYDEAITFVRDTMGQSKIEVFRQILGSEERAQQGHRIFEQSYADAVRRRTRHAAARRRRDDYGTARGRYQGLPGYWVRSGHQGRAAGRDRAGGRSSTWRCRPLMQGVAGRGRTCRSPRSCGWAAAP